MILLDTPTQTGVQRFVGVARMWIPAFAGMTGSASGGDVGPEVAPGGVGLFDQGDLPGAVPVFELFFATDGGRHVVVKFEVNQQVHAVFLRKAFCGVIAMLPDALRQIARNANVQGAVLATRE